jgi:hypothetical protein
MLSYNPRETLEGTITDLQTSVETQRFMNIPVSNL